MYLRSVSCVAFASLCVFLSSAAQAQDAPENEEPAPASEAPLERRIDILNYQIEGNSVLDQKDIERAVLPYLGPQRPVSDVDKARQALTDAYHSKGFETVNVVVPAQDVQQGIVRLKVVEMKIGRLRVDGATYYSPEDIKESIPSLQEGSVPNYEAVSLEIADINKSADRLITPTLRAGLEPGTVDVDLMVDDSVPVHGSLEVNDRASSNTSRYKLVGAVSYGNLFQRGHSVNIQTQFGPEDPAESWVISGSYAAPLHGTPWTLVGYGVHSDSDVAAVGGINVLGSGDIVGGRAIYTSVAGDPMAPRIHQFTFGADYKNFEENLLGMGSAAKTPIDYVSMMLRYSQRKQTESYDFDFGIGAAFGLRGLGGTEEEFRLKRYNASANWTALRGDLAYKYKLESGWQFGASFAGQYAGEPIISNEQFSIGGLDSVRGYYESFQTGDDGISGQFQIDTPSADAFAPDLLRELRLFAFADAGWAQIYDPLATQPETSQLLSVGSGITMRAVKGFNADVLVARPLRDEQSTLLDINDEYRVQFRVWNEF